MRIAIACLLFLLVFISHSSSKVIVSTDSMWSIYLAQSFIKDGDLILDEYRERAKERKNYGLRKRKGQLYSYFPVGTALMAVPFVWAYNQFTPSDILPGFPRAAEQRSAEDLNLPLQRTIASVFVGLTVVCIFFLACSQLSLPLATIAALIAAFCTPLWSTASRGLWQHGPSALLIAVSLLMLSKSKAKPILAGFSGALLAYAYIVRPTNAVALICFGIYLFFNNKQALKVYILSALLIFIPFCTLSYDFLNRWLPPYYNGGRLQVGWHLPQALVANLFSPNRGLFFLSPILIPCIWMMFKTLKSFEINSFAFAILGAFGGHLLAVSLFPEWWGGHAFGARYMCETIPYVLFFFIIWLKDFKASKVRIALLSTLAAISFFIHLKGATDPYTFNWNIYPTNIDRSVWRVWDVSDLQFLR